VTSASPSLLVGSVEELKLPSDKGSILNSTDSPVTGFPAAFLRIAVITAVFSPVPKSEFGTIASSTLPGVYFISISAVLPPDSALTITVSTTELLVRVAIATPPAVSTCSLVNLPPP